MKKILQITSIFFLFFSFNIVSAEESHGHNHKHEEGVSEISDHIAKQVNLETGLVSPQVLKQRFSTYGKLTTSPEQLSHVRARFPGLITSVNVTVGDKVKVGTRLANVESNDSLQTYKINSPIEGMVIQRHANTGEFTSEQVLFSIANFEKLWAELRVYPPQRPLVKSGQPIEIIANNAVFSGKVEHLIPVVDQPYQLARVEIDNTQLSLSPGDFVEGHITFAEFKVDVAISNEAIQVIDGKQGVFVKSGEKYTFTPIKIGRSDTQFSEVLSGIHVNDQYVIENSYLLKADIEKSEAEHAH